MIPSRRGATLVFALVMTLATCSGRQHTSRSGAGALTEAPFLFTKTQIVLPVSIAGAGPFNMLVDTGVDPSVIDLAVARSLGLRLDSLSASAGAGGGSANVSVFPSEMRRMQIGAFQIDSIEAVAVNLSGLSQRLGMPLHGILGYSFFKNRIVQIDYPGRILRLYDRMPPSRAGVKLPFVLRPNDIIPLVPITVNGVEAIVSLDTGSGRVLEIYPAAIEKLRLTTALAAARPIELTGARGEFAAKVSQTDSLRFGPIHLENFEVTFSSRGEQTERGRDGNLGNGVLQGSVLTLDYIKNLITITTPADQ